MLIRAAHFKFSKKNFDVIFSERKKLFQRLLASAEGPFTAVCLITRPARRREAHKVLRH